MFLTPSVRYGDDDDAAVTVTGLPASLHHTPPYPLFPPGDY